MQGGLGKGILGLAQFFYLFFDEENKGDFWVSLLINKGKNYDIF